MNRESCSRIVLFHREERERVNGGKNVHAMWLVRFLNFQRLFLYDRNHRVILRRSASAIVCYPFTSWFMIRNLFTAVIHWTMSVKLSLLIFAWEFTSTWKNSSGKLANQKIVITAGHLSKRLKTYVHIRRHKSTFQNWPQFTPPHPLKKLMQAIGRLKNPMTWRRN